MFTHCEEMNTNLWRNLWQCMLIYKETTMNITWNTIFRFQLTICFNIVKKWTLTFWRNLWQCMLIYKETTIYHNATILFEFSIFSQPKSDFFFQIFEIPFLPKNWKKRMSKILKKRIWTEKKKKIKKSKKKFFFQEYLEIR